MVTKRRMYPIYVYVVVLMLCITALITTVNAASITVTSPTTGMNWEWDLATPSPGVLGPWYR